MPPLRPAVLTAALSGTNVVLTWTTSGPNPTKFDVFRDGANLSGPLGGTVRTYTDSAVTQGATYSYQIRSTRDAGTAWSNIETRTIPITTPAPTIAPVLSATAGNAQVSLSWNAVADATSYELQRKTGAGSYSEINDDNVLSFLDTGRINGTAYTYRVRGTSTGGNGPWSAEVTRTPSAGVLAAPTLTGEAGDGENYLHSTTVAGAAEYRFRWRAQPGDAWTMLIQTAATDVTDDSATNGVIRYYSVRAVAADGTLGAGSNEISLTAEAAAPPPSPTFVGYGSITTGGDGASGGNTYTVNTSAGTETSRWTDFKNYCSATSNPHKVLITGSGNINGSGEVFSGSTSNLTIDGTNWTAGSFKRASLRFKDSSNVKLIQLRLRVGEPVNAPSDTDALTINSTETAGISRFLIDHCSILWGPDVTLAILNQVSDVTVQYCIIGGGLRQSQHDEAGTADPGHSYGANVTSTVDDTTLYTKRVTFFRNYICHNYTGRNIRGISSLKIEYVNNVVYNWGRHLAHFDPRSGDYVGNMFKKGPGTPSSNLVASTESKNAQPYSDSTWFPLTGTDRNIGFLANGSAFTPTASIAAGAARTGRVAALGSALAQGAFVPATSTLAAEVVAAAGPDHEDAVDAALKADFTNGTGAEGTARYYSGPGFTGPNPHW